MVREVKAKGKARKGKSPKVTQNDLNQEKRRSLTDTAYDVIKKKIITLELAPGTYMNEALIAEQLEIGRTPIHHAVRRLRLEGLIEVIPRKGMIIKPISLNEVMEIVDIRLVNETYCARLAAERASTRDIEDLRSILSRAGEGTVAEDTESQMLCDREFHIAIARAAQNQILAGILRNLHDRSLRFWFVVLNASSRGREVGHEHEAILEAIAEHSPDAAEAEMRAHIMSFRESVAQKLMLV